MSQAETAQFVRELREAMNQLDALPMPTVGELAARWWIAGASWVESRQLRCGRPSITQLPSPTFDEHRCLHRAVCPTATLPPPRCFCSVSTLAKSAAPFPLPSPPHLLQPL